MSSAAVLFDLDGTLVDSIEHIVHCWRETMRTVGLELDRPSILPTIGRPLLEGLESFVPGRGEELIGVYSSIFDETHDAMVRTFPGMVELLGLLRERGLSLGVVTSKRRNAVDKALQAFGLGPLLGAVITMEDTRAHKPSAEPLLLACSRLGVSPAEATYVGDAVVDVLAAHAAGLGSVAVSWGAASEEELRAARPQRLVSDMAQLAEALGMDLLRDRDPAVSSPRA